MTKLELKFFGDFDIHYDGKPLDGFDAPRLQSLVAFLVLHRNAPQSRKHLAFQLWPDSSEAQAQANLRNLVHRLKKVLPAFDQYIDAETQTLQWRADSWCTADAIEFQQLLDVTGDSGTSSETMQRLDSAVALYKGDLMPACYDEWILPEREHLREMYVDALAQLVSLTEARKEYALGIGYARRLVQADPLSEEGYRKLMILYARTGDRANVMRVFQTCAAVLKRELDTEPTAATLELVEQLRRDETPTARPATLRHSVNPNLPVPLTSFVGRTRELAGIRALLERARLVTLTGVGGGGKTRLAIQAAHEMAEQFSDGVWFIDFAPLEDAAAVPTTCAVVLGLREHTGASATETVVEHLQSKRTLLVFDNCEHLLVACSALAQTLLRDAPRVSILATSREPLNVAGEALVTVPPLSLPTNSPSTIEQVATSEAVQLFVARASFALPSFSLHQGNLDAVAQVCRRLDGIPLAIELAAARMRTLSPQQIAARLDDALAVLTRGSSGLPARHQTMRAVLDWSDALLSDAERTLFRRLAVFAGSFTLEAAEHVCVMESDARDETILDLMSNLIDKSLVMVQESANEMRYRMLEPIHEYARDKLFNASTGSDESSLMAAHHLEYFLALAEQGERMLTGPEQGVWLQRLEAEHDNLRAALRWNVGGHDRTEQQLRMAGALWRFWSARGNPSDALHLLENALAQGENSVASVRAKACTGLGTMAWLRADYEQAVRWHSRALELYRQVDDARGITISLTSIGGARGYRGEYDEALALFEQALGLARWISDRMLVAEVLTGMGEIARYRGEYARAEMLNEQAYEIGVKIQHLQQIALSLNNLGLVATKQGEFERAIQLHKQSLAVYRTGAEIHFVPECLEGLAAALASSGHGERAAILLGASEALRVRIDLAIPPIERQDYDQVVESVRLELTEGFDSAWQVGRAMTLEGVIDYALGVST